MTIVELLCGTRWYYHDKTGSTCGNTTGISGSTTGSIMYHHVYTMSPVVVPTGTGGIPTVVNDTTTLNKLVITHELLLHKLPRQLGIVA